MRVEIVFSAICGKASATPLSGRARGALMLGRSTRPVQTSPRSEGEQCRASRAEAKRAARKVRCEDCFFHAQPAVCAGAGRALRDLPPERGRAAPAPAAAVRVPPGAPLARRLGVPLRAGAGGAAHSRRCRELADGACRRPLLRRRSATSRARLLICRSACRAIQLAPGVSDRPWTMIEQNTTSAVRSKMRGPEAMLLVEDEQREGHRGDALGAEPAHEQARGAIGARCRAARPTPPAGARAGTTTATNASAGQPSRVSACNVSSEPKTKKMPSLTISTISSARLLEVLAQVGAADAEHDRGDEHGDEAVAFGREHGQPVGGERDAEREQRLLVGGDRVLQRAPPASRGISSEASQPQARP